MPGLDQTESTDVTVAADQSFDYSEIGSHTSFDYLPTPHYLSDGTVWTPEEFDDDGSLDLSPLSEAAREALLEIDMTFAKGDVAPRRIEIEQAWKARHYNRGYQFLLHNRNGGWTMPGTGTNYGAWNQQLMANMYSTNIVGEKCEILVAALAKDMPRLEFFPVNPDNGPDQDMAEVSDDLKEIWAKNNNLMQLIRDAAGYFCTDDRCLLWTTYTLNGELYGYEDDEEPLVPEDEQQPPTTPDDSEGGTEYQIENDSVVPDVQRKPRGRVITRALGKLEHKVPIIVDDVTQMGVLFLCEDKDEATARAMLPWMKEKIHGGGDGTGETELDRIARENVRQAVPGQYVTGDSLNRHTVVKHTYIRPQMFYDAKVKDEVREELLEKFPDGAKLVKAATEFAYVRNECMDDHCTVGHPLSGSGQNRRALLDSLLPIQDYINELVSLSLDFAKRTVPKKWFDSEAFNMEAMKKQNNVPGTSGPFQRQPGVPVDQLVFVEPVPAPQPWLITYIQWIITSLSEQISGALPSLFGAAITGQVGSEGVATQRDQAMQRVGSPWKELMGMFASTARQAVMLQAQCANKDINDVIPGKGRVSIKLNKMKGSVLCYNESNPEFPQSWAQKQTMLKEVLDMAMAAGAGSDIYKLVYAPKNLKFIKAGLGLKDFEIAGAASVEKQEAEMQVLLRSGPLPNPAKVQGMRALMAAQQQVAQWQAAAQQGLATPAMLQMLQQAPQMLQQAEQQVQQMPDEISTVPVRQDDSEAHDIEADVVFDWANGPNGRKFANGTPEQKAAFANALLHRTEHMQMATKIAQQKAAAAAPPPQPPKVSFSSNVKDLPPDEAAKVVMAGGIPALPADFQQVKTVDNNLDLQKKILPDIVTAPLEHGKPSNEPEPVSSGGKNPGSTSPGRTQ